MSAKLNLRDGGREEETKRGDQLVQYGDVLIFTTQMLHLYVCKDRRGLGEG